jgi:hypothetical protein
VDESIAIYSTSIGSDILDATDETSIKDLGLIEQLSAAEPQLTPE